MKATENKSGQVWTEWTDWTRKGQPKKQKRTAEMDRDCM